MNSGGGNDEEYVNFDENDEIANTHPANTTK